MAVIDVNKMWSRTGSNATADDTFQNLTLDITDAYQIVCGATTTLVEIYAATGVPVIGDQHPEYPDCYVRDLQVQRVSPIMYITTVTYTGKSNQIDQPVITWSDTGDVDEPIDQDWNGYPIVTANGEPIEGVTMKVADQSVTIQRKFLFFNAYIANAYRHSVNSDTFLDFPPGMGRLTHYNANRVEGYWDVSATITFRYPYRTTAYKAWWARTRHEGYYVRGSDGKIRRGLDTDYDPTGPGEPLIRPMLLTVNGYPQSNPNNAVWFEWQRYGYLPYNALGLI